jgi:hypothetical protein
MASRPAIRALTNVVRSRSSQRYLHMTDPSNIHDTTPSSDIAKSNRRPQAPIALSSTESAESARDFTTTSKRSAWGDSSTIDFAYLPSALDPDASHDGPIRVPILLNTMYSGANARAMYEDEPAEAVSFIPEFDTTF